MSSTTATPKVELSTNTDTSYTNAFDSSFSAGNNHQQPSATTSSQFNINQIKERILERMRSFTNAPFTIQRISELLLKPNSHYNKIEKFLRGLEKCVMVVTTVDPNGNKIFIESNSPTTNYFYANYLETPIRPTTPSNITTNQVVFNDTMDDVYPSPTTNNNNIAQTLIFSKKEETEVENESPVKSNPNTASADQTSPLSPSSMEISSSSSNMDISNDFSKQNDFVDESTNEKREEPTPKPNDDNKILEEDTKSVKETIINEDKVKREADQSQDQETYEPASKIFKKEIINSEENVEILETIETKNDGVVKHKIEIVELKNVEEKISFNNNDSTADIISKETKKEEKEVTSNEKKEEAESEAKETL
jgi:serine/threonine-protein phosphatase 4 regulatory subunit 2